MQQDFFQHVSNYEGDHGERKVIGYRVRAMDGFKDEPKGLSDEDLAEWREKHDPEGKLKQIPDASRPAQGKDGRIVWDNKYWMRVSLFVRRVPEDKEQDFALKYRQEREVQDALGNKRIEYFTAPEDRNQMRIEKIVWMWTDCENLWMTPLDKDGAKLFSKALGSEVKPGQSVKLDGKLTEELKLDLVKRFKELQTWVMEAYMEFIRRDKEKVELLRKN